jgi:hypothetical protein
MNEEELGSTGLFPDGMLSDADKGELKLAIWADAFNDVVLINFGKPVAWIALPPQSAIEFARMIIKNAEKLIN